MDHGWAAVRALAACLPHWWRRITGMHTESLTTAVPASAAVADLMPDPDFLHAVCAIADQAGGRHQTSTRHRRRGWSPLASRAFRVSAPKAIQRRYSSSPPTSMSSPLIPIRAARCRKGREKATSSRELLG
ncbi:hypothetical protein BKA80DRAFT_256370 [Phyllosticta citrichinensis]